MSSVENQGLDPDCWAYAAAGIVEGQIQILYGSLIDGGVNLNKYEIDPDSSEGTAGGALSYILYDKVGTDTLLDSYPNLNGVRWGITNWDWVVSFLSPCNDKINTIKAALSNGPVTAAFNVYGDFSQYFVSPNEQNVYRYNGVDTLIGLHCVAIVSYDDADSSWLCRNSWGSAWADGGYFRIGYNECGIDTLEVCSVTVDRSCYAKIVPNLFSSLSDACSYPFVAGHVGSVGPAYYEWAKVFSNNTVNDGQPLTIPSNAYIGFLNGASLTVNGNLSTSTSLIIPAGSSLIVNHGALLKFADGASLTVKGVLNAEGTSSQPITFTRSGNSGSWGGIILQGNSLDTLNYCNISGATYGVYAANSGGVCTNNTEPTIQNCTITNNSYGLYYSGCGIFSNPIQNSTISNNYAHGIYMYASSPQNVVGNAISNNGGDGICLCNSSGEIKGNTISGNGGHGIYCCDFSTPNIQYNDIARSTISNNYAHGIYMYASSPRNVVGNVISNNGGDGICLCNSSGEIKGNTISGNGGHGIYCYDFSTPIIQYNDIAHNGNGDGVHCEYYSPATLGAFYSDSGSNAIHDNYYNIAAVYMSNVEAGDYYGYGLNTIYNDLMAAVCIDDSWVDAEGNYWGGGIPRYDMFGGEFDYDNILSYNPDSGMGMVVRGGNSASKGSLNKTGANGAGSDTSTFFDLGLESALQAMLNGKYDDAIEQYTNRYKSETDWAKKRYVLVQLGECYSLAKKNNFIDFLNTDVRPNLSQDDRLYATTLELENHFLIRDGKQVQAIANFDTLMSRFAGDKATVKHALYGLWSLYFQNLSDTESAKGYLDELKAQFPKDDLTRHAELLAGEIDTSSSQPPNIVVPANTELEANYPNPFNPVTTIRYKIAWSDHVTLKVYDILGREIATLVDGYVQAGEYSVAFNASHLSSGCYFYVLRWYYLNFVKKMLLMK
jgi:parallel beta-helix repeat protein